MLCEKNPLTLTNQLSPLSPVQPNMKCKDNPMTGRKYNKSVLIICEVFLKKKKKDSRKQVDKEDISVMAH